jgi:hypothetical protein
MQAMNNTPYHWRDTHVQYLLGDGFAHLRAYRDAGVIGIQFGFGGVGPDDTCACDAKPDGVTNPPGLDGTERFSKSPDDDGGYLAARAAAYRRTGALGLRPVT